ncbi:MAG: dTDP-4-dehydrorhamnose reductase [Chlamydiota bacterium]|jgi:dTDP-4-dehydrorhamnose reductase
MKLWIIGSGGLVGSTLLKKIGSAVGTTHQECDITDREAVRRCMRQINPTHVINCAAYTNVDRAEEEEKQVFAINRDGPCYIAEAVREAGSKFIHISTDYVFGKEERLIPYKENDRCGPVNVYGFSKLAGEEGVLSILPSACIVRTSWVFDAKGRNFVSTFLHKIKRKEKIEAAYDQVGKITYCPDLCDALLKLLNHEGIIHFANEGQMSRFEVAKCLGGEVLPVSSEMFSSKAKRPSYSALSTALYTKITGSSPRLGKEVLKEFLSHAL